MITFGRRLIAVPLLSAFLLATPVTAGQQTDAERQAREQQAREPFVLDGPIAIWTVAIRPDKTTDFEAIIGRVREALVTSPSAERRQQAMSWTVIKLAPPLADGTIAYVHLVNPVVAGADYSLMHILYDAYPHERFELYQRYKNAFAQNLALAHGAIVHDMAKPPVP